MAFLKNLFGDANQRAVKGLQPLVDQINSKKAEVAGWSTERFRTRATELR